MSTLYMDTVNRVRTDYAARLAALADVLPLIEEGEVIEVELEQTGAASVSLFAVPHDSHCVVAFNLYRADVASVLSLLALHGFLTVRLYMEDGRSHWFAVSAPDGRCLHLTSDREDIVADLLRVVQAEEAA